MNLIHLTRNIKNIKSILVDGFVPTVNVTKVWDEMFNDIGENIPDIENGMISFTEISENISTFQNSFMRAHFGDFGIAANYNWAIDNGVRRVAYIQKDGEEYNCIKSLLKKSFPVIKYKSDILPNDEVDRYFRMFINNPTLPDTFTNPLFSLMVYFMQWVETDKHSDENELRIRSSKLVGGLSQYQSFEQVDLIKALANNAIINHLIKIDKINILYLLCPTACKDEFIEMLKGTNFYDIEVKYY